MNTIGIENNLDRARIKKLLTIGLVASVMTGVGDFLLGYAEEIDAGIFGYIWLAPIGCHLNMGILNLAYKYLLRADAELAAEAAGPLFYGFSLPVYILLAVFWLPMIVIQFEVFAKGFTPYPSYAKWFNVVIGGLPTLVISQLVPHTALAAGIGTMFLSFGNAFMFGGPLAASPSQDVFDDFRITLAKK